MQVLKKDMNRTKCEWPLPTQRRKTRVGQDKHGKKRQHQSEDGNENIQKTLEFFPDFQKNLPTKY